MSDTPRPEFHADVPISADAEDVLGTGAFADRLVRPLLDAPGGPSLVVGLYGAWGQGKSSVLNLLAARLRATAAEQTLPGAGGATTQGIVVRFNPWLYGDVAALLYAFFETLAAEIGGGAA